MNQSLHDVPRQTGSTWFHYVPQGLSTSECPTSTESLALPVSQFAQFLQRRGDGFPGRTILDLAVLPSIQCFLGSVAWGQSSAFVGSFSGFPAHPNPPTKRNQAAPRQPLASRPPWCLEASGGVLKHFLAVAEAMRPPRRLGRAWRRRSAIKLQAQWGTTSDHVRIHCPMAPIWMVPVNRAMTHQWVAFQELDAWLVKEKTI